MYDLIISSKLKFCLDNNIYLISDSIAYVDEKDYFDKYTGWV